MQSIPDALPHHAVEIFLEIDEEQTRRISEFHRLLQNDLQSINVLSADGSRAEPSLHSVD